MFDVITIGAATRDVFIRSRAFTTARHKAFTNGWAMVLPLGSKLPVEEIHFETGGGATNTAVTFARLGFRTAFVGNIGAQDARGHDVVSVLKAEGVHTSLVTHDPKHKTGYSVLLVTPRGERTALVYRGASAVWQPQRVAWKQLRAKWLYVTSLSGDKDMLRRVFAHAKKNQINIAWNPGAGELALGARQLGVYLRQADVIFLNQEEAARLTGNEYSNGHAMLHDLCFGVPGIVVITEGRKGATVCDNAQRYSTVPNNVPVHNTTGAGDAFGSGFVAGLLKKPGDIAFALQVATANSESVIQSLGAKEGIIGQWPRPRQRCRVRVTRYPNPA